MTRWNRASVLVLSVLLVPWVLSYLPFVEKGSLWERGAGLPYNQRRKQGRREL